MKRLENLLESWILHTSQLQYSIGIEVLNDANIKTACDGKQQYPMLTLTLENYSTKKEWTNHTQPQTQRLTMKTIHKYYYRHRMAKYSLKLQNQIADQIRYCQPGQCNHPSLTGTFRVINSGNVFGIGAFVLWYKYVNLVTMVFSVKIQISSPNTVLSHHV